MKIINKIDQYNINIIEKKPFYLSLEYVDYLKKALFSKNLFKESLNKDGKVNYLFKTSEKKFNEFFLKRKKKNY